VDAHNGGLEGQNRAMEGLHMPVVADSHHFEEELNPDLH
jgi:hypothetical protein